MLFAFVCYNCLFVHGVLDFNIYSIIIILILQIHSSSVRPFHLSKVLHPLLRFKDRPFRSSLFPSAGSRSPRQKIINHPVYYYIYPGSNASASNQNEPPSGEVFAKYSSKSSLSKERDYLAPSNQGPLKMGDRERGYIKS